MRPIDDDRYRILVIADESCMTPGFVEELRRRAAGRQASVRRFPADEILFVTHPDTGSSWLETGVVAQAEERYEQPVKHIVGQDG